MKDVIRRTVTLTAGVALSVIAIWADTGSGAEVPANVITVDSLNRAVAVVMAANLDEVIAELQSHKVPVDRAEVGRYVAALLAGGEPYMSRVHANALVDGAIRANMPRRAAQVSAEREQAFVDSIAATPGSVRLPSGVVFTVITEGEGVFPKENDRVRVKYVARLSDGSAFDDTEGEAITFDVSKVIPGFSEGLQMMKPGGTYRVVIPSSQGYGEEGIPDIIPGNAALDFTVTLEEVIP